MTSVLVPYLSFDSTLDCFLATLPNQKRLLMELLQERQLLAYLQVVFVCQSGLLIYFYS